MSKFKVDTYALRGEEIVCERYPDRRIRVRELHAWKQVFVSFGVSVIQLRTADGRAFEWNDRYGHLISLLQGVAAEREEPFEAA